jgi:nucleoside-diphosphate-sugar epimerase
MTASAVVTGAAGFIGSNLVDHLLSRGYQVIGIDNFDTGRHENLAAALQNKRFRLIEADISSGDLSREIKTDIGLVFHLAAISSVKRSLEDPVLVNRVNVTGTLQVLEMARKLDATRVVFSSSAAVYGNPERMPVQETSPCSPLSPYAASKLAGELYVQSFGSSYGIEYSTLRYFNVYGPRQAYSEYSGVISIFINQALRNLPIAIEGTGENTRSFIYVTDVIDATLLAGISPNVKGLTVNISGVDTISIADLAQVIKESVKGTKSSIVHVAPRPGDVKHSTGSMKQANGLLGFTPKVKLKNGLQKTTDWFRAHTEPMQ